MEQRRWLLLALALRAAIPLSGNFDVTSPQNVIGIVDQDTILPCTISSTKPLDNPELHWIKITDGHPENIYTHRQSGGEPVQKYRGRASVPGDGLVTRNVSLTLKNVQPADEGTYRCTLTSRDWSADTSTELSIAGTGEVFLEVLGPQGQGLELGCRSQGWFPKPTVQWVTEDGQGLSADTEIHQDSEKLFHVWSRVTVTREQVGKITCQILNPLLQVEKKTTVHLSGAAFPHMSPFVPAFWTVFSLFLLTLAAGAVLAFRGRRVKSHTPEVLEYMLQKEIQQISQKIQTLHMQESSQWHLNNKPELSRVRSYKSKHRGNEEGPQNNCSPEGHRRKISQRVSKKLSQSIQNPCVQEEKRRRNQLFQVESYKEFVTLDADTAHPRLEISADGRRVKDSGVIRDVPSNEKRFDSNLFVLAKEGFTSGRHYWEVCVGLRRRNWALGIALESVTRKGPLTLSPENGFWAIGLADGRDYWAYTDCCTPLSVSGNLQFTGIFLDIPAKQVTFYDALKGTALYTFSIADGSSQEGKLIPFLSIGPATAEPDPQPLVIYG